MEVSSRVQSGAESFVAADVNKGSFSPESVVSFFPGGWDSRSIGTQSLPVDSETTERVNMVWSKRISLSKALSEIGEMVQFCFSALVEFITFCIGVNKQNKDLHQPLSFEERRAMKEVQDYGKNCFFPIWQVINSRDGFHESMDFSDHQGFPIRKNSSSSEIHKCKNALRVVKKACDRMGGAVMRVAEQNRFSQVETCTLMYHKLESEALRYPEMMMGKELQEAIMFRFLLRGGVLDREMRSINLERHESSLSSSMAMKEDSTESESFLTVKEMEEVAKEAREAMLEYVERWCPTVYNGNGAEIIKKRTEDAINALQMKELLQQLDILSNEINQALQRHFMKEWFHSEEQLDILSNEIRDRYETLLLRCKSSDDSFEQRLGTEARPDLGKQMLDLLVLAHIHDEIATIFERSLWSDKVEKVVLGWSKVEWLEKQKKLL